METRRSKRTALPPANPAPKRARGTRSTKREIDKGKESESGVVTRSGASTHASLPTSLPSSAPVTAPAAASAVLDLNTRVSNQSPTLPELSVPNPEQNRNINMERRQQRSGSEGPSSQGDEDKDLGAEVFGRNLSSASSALQGLLRKLGVGIEDMMILGGMTGSNLKSIISNLRSDDEGQQLSALTELCELLAVSSEATLTSFPVETIVPLLVNLLNMEHHPDMMLLAARAITFMADVMPQSCSAIVRHGAVPALCARLITIEYIDLAEQSLTALEKLSVEHASALLAAGGLLAVLSFLDFFPTGVQRVAVATAAHMVQGVGPTHVDAVREAIPILTNLLQHTDNRVVDSACLALTHIADAFSARPDLMELLSDRGLLSRALDLISVSESGTMSNQLSVSTYFGLVKLLAACSTGSPAVSASLLDSGVATTLTTLLSTSSLLSSGAAHTAVLRTPDQLAEVVGLAEALLPSAQDPVALVLSGGKPVYAGAAGKSSAGTGPSSSASTCPRVAYLAGHAPEAQILASKLLPLLLQVYASTVLPAVRQRCLSAVLRIVSFVPVSVLSDVLPNVAIAAFVSNLLSNRDCTTCAASLVLAEVILSRLPTHFRPVFVREGVLHAVEVLAAGAPANSSALSSSLAEAGKNRVTRATSKLKEVLEKSERTKVGAPSNSAPEKPSAATPATAATAATQPPLQLREAVALRALRFRDEHYGSSSIGSQRETEGLAALRSAAELIRAGDSAGVASLFTLVSSPNGASVFEILSSGVVPALAEYLKGHGTKGDENVLLGRLKGFVKMGLECSSTGAPLQHLVRKLQAALSSAETFPVLCSRMAAPGSSRGGAGTSNRSSSMLSPGSLASGLSALTQPFKLRLRRASGEKVLREYANNIVLIEPLATMSAVEEFLWPRVQRTSGTAAPSADAGTQLGRSASGSEATRSENPSSSAAATAAAATRLGLGVNARRAGASAPAGEPAPSRAQPIPDANTTSTRVTRSRAASEAQAGSSEPAVAPSDEHILVAETGTELDVAGDEDEDEDDAGAAGVDDDMPIFDEDEDDDEEEYEDGLDREDGEVGTMTVHDLHVESREADAPADATTSSVPAAPAASSAPAAALQSASAGHGAGATAAAGVAWGSRLGTSSSSAAVMSAPSRLTFSLGSCTLSSSTTVFQAIQQYQLTARANEQDEEGGAGQDDGEPASSRNPRLWDEVYTLMYRAAQASDSRPSASTSHISSTTNPASAPASWGGFPLADLLATSAPEDLSTSQTCRDVLSLLSVLDVVNRGAARLIADPPEARLQSKEMCANVITYRRLPQEELVSSKLASKLAAQLKDVLVICGGGLPSWCRQLVFPTKFLFPFEVRRRYFYCTAFGLGRALQHMQALNSAEGGGGTSSEREARDLRVGRLQRQKVRVSRRRILESAVKVMELYARARGLLELEYFGEVGTGLGPTLEFYTLLSRELQRRNLNMWRHDDTAACASTTFSPASDHPSAQSASETGLSQYVVAPHGLFPAPLHPSGVGTALGTRVTEYFRLLGRTLAKALADTRLLDLPLSPLFYRAALGKQMDLHDVALIDPSLGRSLLCLHAALRAYNAAGATGPVLVDGVSLEELCLTFTLPGYSQYELIPSGAETPVTAANLKRYVESVVEATLGSGIAAQMIAFREGFNEVFPLSNLECFFEEEIECLVCGTGEQWSVGNLADAIKFDHGYSSSSPQARALLEVLSELTPTEQRAFLTFVTGSPRLPQGGIAALQPRLTVVRKHPSTAPATESLSPGTTPPNSIKDGWGSGNCCADGDLPSVMTCANYIKMPPYSCKAIMAERLMYAVREGQGSFDLS